MQLFAQQMYDKKAMLKYIHFIFYLIHLMDFNFIYFLDQFPDFSIPPSFITLCKFKVYSKMIWYMYILWGDYHNKFS